MKIISGTDFSPNAKEAARAAAAIAARLQFPLWLVHAAEHSIKETTKVGATSTAPAERALATLGESLAKTGAIVMGKVVAKGSATEALLKCAKPQTTHLVVISSVSKTNVQRWTLGSVAETLAAEGRCPTLIVRSADPLVAWAQGKSRLKVFIAVDLSASCESAIHWVRKLREIGPCEITAGHVAWPPEERRRYGISPKISAETSPFAEHALQRDLAKRLEVLLGPNDLRVRVIENWGRPDAALIDMAREERADLMVVGTHQRGGLGQLAHGSVSRGVVRHAPMNVLCVPPSTSPAVEPGSVVPVFERVLAATDFSACGNRAVVLAYAAVAPGGLVKLVHVSRDESAIGLRRKLRDLIPVEASARDLATEVEVIHHQDAGTALVQAAENLGADLICMGTRGESALADVVMGSVAREVTRQTRKPVLLVPNPEP